MSNYEWKSPLSPYMQEHIAIQQAAGFKFEDQIKVLQFFDRYLFYNGYQETLLEKGMTDGFIYTKGERPYSWRRKELVLHKFGIFLRNKGIQSYVPAVKTEVHRSRYIPHIYTREELKRFFKAVDEYPLPTRPIIDGAMFRFLYSTGVRISEALSLTLSDYDANMGTVIIRHAKNDRDRIIPLHPAMKNLLDCYIEILHKYHGGDMPLFPDTHMTKMAIHTAYNHFRDYLFLAGILLGLCGGLHDRPKLPVHFRPYDICWPEADDTVSVNRAERFLVPSDVEQAIFQQLRVQLLTQKFLFYLSQKSFLLWCAFFAHIIPPISVPFLSAKRALVIGS